MKKFVRGLIWAGCMMFLAYLLDVEWTWRILVLCIFASLLDAIICADYSSYYQARRAWKSK